MLGYRVCWENIFFFKSEINQIELYEDLQVNQIELYKDFQVNKTLLKDECPKISIS